MALFQKVQCSLKELLLYLLVIVASSLLTTFTTFNLMYYSSSLHRQNAKELLVKGALDEHFDRLTDLLLQCHKSSLEYLSSHSSYSFQVAKPKPPLYVGNRPIIDMSLHIVCAEEDWRWLGDSLGSVAQQTYLPAETILVLSVSRDGTSIPLQQFPSLPGLKIYVRSGPHTPGSNRNYAASKSTSDLLTFFDCDDYMHPQRIEVLHAIFRRLPGLDAALHSYMQTTETTFFPINARKRRGKASHLYTGGTSTGTVTDTAAAPSPGQSLLVSSRVAQDEVDRFQPCNYETIRQSTPNYGLLPGQNWQPSLAAQKSVEPNWTRTPDWWFPHRLETNCEHIHGRTTVLFHNGWVTVRRRVLYVVEYPDLWRFEDGLFNWRVIKAGFNFTALPWKLGAYVEHQDRPALA